MQYLVFLSVVRVIHPAVGSFTIRVHTKDTHQLLGSNTPLFSAVRSDPVTTDVWVPLSVAELLTLDQVEWGLYDEQSNKLSEEQVDLVIKVSPVIMSDTLRLKT